MGDEKNKLSPFTQIIYFVTNKLSENNIDCDLIRGLPTLYILKMFIDFNPNIKILNDLYNKYSVNSVDNILLLKELKKYYQQEKYKEWFFPKKEKDLEDVLNSLWDVYPDMKKYELEYAYSLLTKDEIDIFDDMYSSKKKDKVKTKKSKKI